NVAIENFESLRSNLTLCVFRTAAMKESFRLQFIHILPKRFFIYHLTFSNLKYGHSNLEIVHVHIRGNQLTGFYIKQVLNHLSVGSKKSIGGSKNL
ncbi:hypothetical protein CDAR_313221, partial [Caerostris darwini]